ncbi:MAG: hypothetical protein U0Y68_00880 [Blastocatellia bacterium]
MLLTTAAGLGAMTFMPKAATSSAYKGQTQTETYKLNPKHLQPPAERAAETIGLSLVLQQSFFWMIYAKQ